MTKRVENSDKLQKITLSALKAATKDKAELKAQVDGLNVEVANLK